MSGEKPKNPLEGMDDLDWDSALSDWETNNFDANIAESPEPVTTKAAEAATAQPEPVVEKPKPEIEVPKLEVLAPTESPLPLDDYAETATRKALSASGADDEGVEEEPSTVRRDLPDESAAARRPEPSPAVPAELFANRTPSTKAAVPRVAPRALAPTRPLTTTGATVVSPGNVHPSNATTREPELTISEAVIEARLAETLDRPVGQLEAAPHSEPTAVYNVAPREPSLVPGQTVADDELIAAVRMLESMPPAPLTSGDEEPMPLIAPKERAHDPDEVTGIVNEEVARAIARTKSVADDEPTRLRPRVDVQAARAEAARIAKEAPVFADERAASTYLDAATQEAFAARIAWLEEEARAIEDPEARARELLAISEMSAIRGDEENAARLADEARDTSKSNPFAHRQARATMAAARDPDAIANALDFEAANAQTPAGKLHATLLAADALTMTGDVAAAKARWDEAARIAPNDVRAPIVRAAHALAASDTNDVSLRLGDAPELAPVSSALAIALRFRGVERRDLEAGATPNDSFRRARAALERGDVAVAASMLSELRSVPELSRGATWLASSLGATRAALRAESAQWMRRLLGQDDTRERRALAARGVELGDARLVETALEGDEAFTVAERLALALLVKLPATRVHDELERIPADSPLAPLTAAASAVATWPTAAATRDETIARASRALGTGPRGQELRIGRLLAMTDAWPEIERALAKIDEPTPAVRAIALEAAARAGRYDEVERAIDGASSKTEAPHGWLAPSDEANSSPSDVHMAAALLSERTGSVSTSIAAYRLAREASRGNIAAIRAIAELDPDATLVADLHAAGSELGETIEGALLQIEAATRATDLPEPTVAAWLEDANRSAPALPIAAFLAERIARRSGDTDAVLRWIRERHGVATDSLEASLDAIREALLVATKEPDLAAARVEEAHRAHPADVALRDLYERFSPATPNDRATWRENNASAIEGTSRAQVLLQASHEYERIGDHVAALRTAHGAREFGDRGLARLAVERAELATGQAARLADELLAAARATSNARERREAYERLAEIDGTSSNDPGSALLWHKTILEETPDYVPSLRYVEQFLVSEGRDEELEPIAASLARTLARVSPVEATAHAALAIRLQQRAGLDWSDGRDLSDVAAGVTEPALWALRAANAHARARGDDTAVYETTRALLARTTRPLELATLHLRAAEAATRLGDGEGARSHLEAATKEDSGDMIAWGQLVEAHAAAGNHAAAAEASESLARTTAFQEHQLLSWYEAAGHWQSAANDQERGVIALENAASIDVMFQDVFVRLAELYRARGKKTELAALLERRLEHVEDPSEKVVMEIERGQLLADTGDDIGARDALDRALAIDPDDEGALAAFGDASARAHDWESAEQAWVRLARLLSSPAEQRAVYAKLGDLYATQAVNLARAEVALLEVLKRIPEGATDVVTLEKLVGVYKRQNDAARAVEVQQQLVAAAPDPATKRARMLEQAEIYDTIGHDARKAEQIYEAARREFPNDVILLRAFADFYVRHKQMPAVNILLDRTAADARRAFAAGKVAPELFAVLATAYDLRGKKAVAKVVGATLAALDAQPSSLKGAEGRACDPKLDDLLAPEVLSASLRGLLARAGDALDTASPVDLRAAGAIPLAANASALASGISKLAASMGVPQLQMFVSPRIGSTCAPCASSPPTILLGEPLLSASNELARTFLVTRALKLVHARASALVRVAPAELALLVAAWLRALNPSWQPEGIPAKTLDEVARRLQPGMPRKIEPELGFMALEVAGTLAANAASIGALTMSWANRAALLAVGDPNAALDGIAWSAGLKSGAPSTAKERTAWATRAPEARDLVAFSVTDAYAEARARTGVD